LAFVGSSEIGCPRRGLMELDEELAIIDMFGNAIYYVDRRP
jgi:hypothetical protein